MNSKRSVSTTSILLCMWREKRKERQRQGSALCYKENQIKESDERADKVRLCLGLHMQSRLFLTKLNLFSFICKNDLCYKMNKLLDEIYLDDKR